MFFNPVKKSVGYKYSTKAFRDNGNMLKKNFPLKMGGK